MHYTYLKFMNKLLGVESSIIKIKCVEGICKIQSLQYFLIFSLFIYPLVCPSVCLAVCMAKDKRDFFRFLKIKTDYCDSFH